MRVVRLKRNAKKITAGKTKFIYKLRKVMPDDLEIERVMTIVSKMCRKCTLWFK